MKAVAFLVPILLLVPTLAYATNESSYLYGKQWGKQEWGDCTTPADDNGDEPYCGTASDVCQSPTSTYTRNETTGLLDMQLHYDVMTNQTACKVGYIHAWNHGCDPVKAHKLSLDCPTTLQKETRG